METYLNLKQQSVLLYIVMSVVHDIEPVSKAVAMLIAESPYTTLSILRRSLIAVPKMFSLKSGRYFKTVYNF